MTRKLTLLALIILAFASTATAASWSLPSTSVSYDDSTDARIDCTGSDCPNGITVEICGEEEVWDVLGTSGDTVYYTIDGSGGSLVEVPQDYACTTGNHELSVYESSTFLAEGGSFKVEATKSNPNRGYFLHVGMQTNDDTEQLNGAVLTNQTPDWFTDYPVATDTVWVTQFYPNALWKSPEGNLSGVNDKVFQRQLGSSLDDISQIDYNSISDCENNPCEVFTTEVSSENTFEYRLDDIGLTEVSPVHSNGEYYPDGEIVSGNTKDFTGFFICRTGSDGKSVEQDNGDIVRCDVKGDSSDPWRDYISNDWESVTECSDGLDNDGDGAIDLNDPECGSSTDPSESEGATCSPRVGELSDGTKAAFYDSSGDKYTDTTSDCTYANADTDVDYTGQPPELFTCKENFNGAIGYSGSDSEDNGNAVDSSGADYFCTTLTNYHSNSEMKVVEYFAAKTDIPTGNNKYATSSGFKNKFYQTLHDSETKNAGTDPEHDKATWDSLGLVDLSDGYSSGEYIDSWMIGNASAQISKISSTDGTIDQDSVFNGGFAGKCGTGQIWLWDDTEARWACTGAASNWDQAVLVPDIQGQGMKSATVGMVIMPYNLVETSNDLSAGGDLFEDKLDQLSSENEDLSTNELSNVRSYKEAKAESMPDADFATDSVVPDLETLDVTCYADANPSSKFSESVTLNVDESNPKPVAVTGEVDLSTSSSYTCNWEYVNSDGESVVDQGEPVDIANTGSKNEVLFDFFKNDRGFSNLEKSYTPKEFESAASNWN